MNNYILNIYIWVKLQIEYSIQKNTKDNCLMKNKIILCNNYKKLINF